jgi:hypothetical protein
MSYLRTFAPWIAFSVFPASDWQWGALVALAISVVGIARQTRSGLPLDAQIIEIGSAAFFAAVAVLAFADPHTVLHAYSNSLSSGALGLIAGVSLALRKPFTLGIAKRSVPREHWDSPLFIRTNMIITAAWTASFLVGCVLLAFLAHSSVLIVTIVQVAAFVVPLVFTIRYVARARGRAAASAENGPAAENGSAAERAGARDQRPGEGRR